MGYPPLLAFWAAEGELLFSQLRRGSAHTVRHAVWFLRQPRQRRPAGATCKLRADRGFYSHAVVEWGEAAGVPFTLTAAQTAPLLAASAALPERRGHPLPEYDLAAVAELRSQPVGWGQSYRSVVKREVAEKKTGELYWHYHVLVTNEAVQPAAAVMVWHWQPAEMENAITEPKSGLGLEKLPTQQFPANWAYLLMGQIACNLVAWFKRLVLPASYQRTTIRTLRHPLLNLAGKIVHTARRCFLSISEGYRYQAVWQFAIKRLGALQFT